MGLFETVAAIRSAIVAILRKGHRVLIIQRGPRAIRSGYWAPLSGRVEPGETQEAALVREIREEVGLTARPLAKVWECPTDDGDFVLHWWTAAFESGALALDTGEVADARWVTVEEYLELHPTFDGDRQFFIEIFPTLSSY